MTKTFLTALSPLALIAASCSAAATGDSPPAAATTQSVFAVAELGTFAEPWAMAVLPDGALLVTEKVGKVKLRHKDGRIEEVASLTVDYGGQGGLGDVVLAPDFAKSGKVWLSWVEAGENDTRGAVVGWAQLVRGEKTVLSAPTVVWRQSPKVTGRGHYSHRIAFSPDAKYLFISSGERMKFDPAQDLTVNLGKVLRLLPDGTPAPGNPFAAKGGVSAEIWTLGHRNLLGLEFDAKGRLWDLEHGPKGGDELNLIKPGQNYGWPVVSQGDHYDGKPIPRHDTHPEFAKSAISWNPVIAPGGFIFYSGKMWKQWKGQAIIAGLGSKAIVRVGINGETGQELARHPFDKRLRAIAEAADGSLLVLEDGKGGRLLKLSRPK